MNALTLRDLSLSGPGGTLLLEGIGFSLGTGEALSLIGETGSGKSLIGQAVMGLLPAGMTARGEILLNGRRHEAGDREALRAHWGSGSMLMPQEPSAALDPSMRIGAQLAETASPSRARAALEAVGLGGAASFRTWPYALSGGMAQRALAAMTGLSAAPLLVVDEPTKGLDDARVMAAIDSLCALRDAGRALLVVTHDLRVARRLGGEVLVLREGRIVESGPAERLLTAPSQAYTRAWLAADPRNWPARETAPPFGAPILSCAGLSFGHDRRKPLAEGLEVSLPAGGVLGLSGPSGCGKTTMGDVLLGLRRPLSGAVRWAEGVDPYADPQGRARLRSAYQKLHQDPVRAFAPRRLLGRQFEDLSPVVPLAKIRARLPALMARLKLRPELLRRFPHEVSGGEAQRLAMARLLLLEPRLIVADEPTSRLDPILQRETVDLLAELTLEEGLALVLIAHDEALLAAAADRVIRL